MRRITAIIFAGLFLLSCERAFEFSSPLSVTSERIEMNASEGSTPIIVYANGSWTAALKENAAWASLEKTSGDGLGEVIVHCAANEGLARMVTLEITSGSDSKSVQIVQKSGFGDIVFSFVSKSMTVCRNGAAGRLPFDTNLPASEFGKIQASALSEEGTPITWLSGIKLSGQAVELRVGSNDTGANRVAALTLSYTDNMGTEYTTSLKLTQADEAPYIGFDEEVLGEKFSSLAATVSLPYKANLWPYMTAIAAASSSSAPWAKIRFPEDGSAVILVDLEENTAFLSRTATLTFPFTDASGICAPFTYILTQKGTTAKLEFADVKGLVSGDVYEFTDEAAIEGVVISDCSDPNMETAPNLSASELDTGANKKTAYVQSLDGTSGFRLQFASAGDNILKRGDRVMIDLFGLTIVREKDPLRYTIKNITAASISVQPDRETPVVREKKLSQLTDDDVYTMVKVKGLEMSFKHGAYTNCHDAYALACSDPNPAGQKTNGTGSNSSPQKFDTTPCSMIDADGGEINLLINNAVTWRRYGNGVPQGLCDVQGILVHTELARWARNGNLGRYQLRPSAESDIAPAGEAFSKVIVSWYKGWEETTLSGDAAKAAGMHPEGVQATISSNLDGLSGVKVETAINFNDLTNYNASPAVSGYYKGQVKNAALGWKKTGGYFWASDNPSDLDAAPWFQIAFSTAGLSGSQLRFIWSVVQGSSRGATDDIQGPTLYKVEYSTDGVSFTALDRIYAVYPVVTWADKAKGVFMVPGLHQYVTPLPASLLGKDKVYVRVRAASNVSIDNNFLDPEGGKIVKYSSSLYTMIRFGEMTVQYN